MEAKIIAAAFLYGNILIKNKNHEEIEKFISNNLEFLSINDLIFDEVCEKFKEIKISENGEFSKDQNFEFICLDTFIHFNKISQEGFIDEKGKFLTRNQALHRAIDTGQIKCDANCTHEAMFNRGLLCSEMLNY